MGTGIKGFKSQKMLKSKLKGYTEDESIDTERYATIQELTGDKHGVDTVIHGVYKVNALPLTVAAGSNIRTIKCVAHGAVKGDQIRFILSGVEASVLSTPDADTIILGSELSFSPIGLDFNVLKHVTPLYGSDGSLSISSGPVAFVKNSVTTTVNEDTAVVANNKPLPNGMFIKKDDGNYYPVTLDTTNPYNHTPIPVAITDVTGTANVNITAGDLNVSIKHNGVDPSSVRIGDGTNLAAVNASNELKVIDTDTHTKLDTLHTDLVDIKNNQTNQTQFTRISDGTNIAAVTAASEVKVNDADSHTKLDTLHTDLQTLSSAQALQATINVLGDAVSTSRFNQVEINFETPPGATLITNTTSGGATITASNGHTAYSTGTALTAEAKGVSVYTTKYRPANESYAFFTAAFTTPTSGASYQRIGLYDTNNGFFIGFEGTTFGVVKRTAAVDTVIPRGTFSGDLLDGSSGSKFTRNGTPEAINLTYSNLFRIRFAWLGSASILFEVFSPDAKWVVFHTIKTPNSQLNPSIEMPDLPMTIDVKKTASNATDLKIWTACWAAGTTSNLVKITDVLNDNTLATMGRTIITGVTTGGGGGYVNVKVNPSGALVADVTGSVTANAGTNLNTSALNLETTQTAMSAKLPASLGAKAGSASLSVVPATDASFKTVEQPLPAATITTIQLTVGLTAVRATVAGTAPAGSRKKLWIKPSKNNTGAIYIGASGVLISTGMEIIGPDRWEVLNDNNDYYLISDTAGQVVEILEVI